jgi:hypothetical protein
VAVVAIQRDAARLGRKRNQRPDRRRHLRQTAGGRTHAVVPERIVAAGVEQHQVDPGAGFFHLVENAGGADHLRKDIGFVLRMGIDRHQIIEAVRLHAMAGVIKQRDVGAGQFLAEFASASSKPALSRSSRAPPPTTKKPSDNSVSDISLASASGFGSAGTVR